MTINDRFRLLREACNKNQSEWADILGLSRSGVSEIESGRRSVTDKHIKLLCVDPIDGNYINGTWLRTGEGEMFKPRPPEDEIGYYVEQLLENEDNPLYRIIIEMMKTYHGLDEKSKEVIRNYFSGVEKAIQEKKED